LIKRELRANVLVLIGTIVIIKLSEG